MTRSMAASRLLDMPTSEGDLTGKPSPARVTVRAVRITLSNANSLNYTYLYWPYSARFLSVAGASATVRSGGTYSCKRFQQAKVTGFSKETSFRSDVTKPLSEMPIDQLDLKRAIAG